MSVVPSRDRPSQALSQEFLQPFAERVRIQFAVISEYVMGLKMTNTIQSLWVGQRLSTMERLSIASYLYHGHSYHLYTYGSVSGVPTRVMVRDASEILPKSEISKFRHIANFSDYFRYNLLLKKGGWWCDTDTVCLRPFDLIDEHVFVQEYPYEKHTLINGGYLKAPANSPVMQWLVGQTPINELEQDELKGRYGIAPTVMARFARGVRHLKRRLRSAMRM